MFQKVKTGFYILVTSGRSEYVIKLLIHFPLLSLDTSLQKPDSAIYNLPAIFEVQNGRQLKYLLRQVLRWCHYRAQTNLAFS